MTIALAATPLHDWHAAHGGRMVDFAGWSMPVQYGSIVTEHLATRNAVGLFDVSHMGRLRFDGPKAGAFLDQLVTRRISDQTVGQVRYALVTRDDGGILDDVLVYHLQDAQTGKPYHLMVVNASNRQKILDWVNGRLFDSGSVQLTDLTVDTAMIAVQGPHARDLLQPFAAQPLGEMKYYTAIHTYVEDQPAIVSRTGYTGEDGWELIVPASAALGLWTSLLAHGKVRGATAAGLGCRDTLRLEAGMPLYGHELSEQIHPWMAGLGFAVNVENRTFPGRDMLVRLRDQADWPRRVGCTLEGKRVPREGYPVLAAGTAAGHITSGTFSPTLDRPIAMAYVRADLARESTEIAIDIRGRQEPARVVKLPFYRRKT